MKLKTKARIVFVVYTAMIFFQVLFAVLIGAVAHYFSRDFARDCFNIAQSLVDWRNDAHYWYVESTKRDYSLDAE